jgi:hypothetical protein
MHAVWKPMFAIQHLAVLMARYNKIVSGNILGDFSTFSSMRVISVASAPFRSYYIAI